MTNAAKTDEQLAQEVLKQGTSVESTAEKNTVAQESRTPKVKENKMAQEKQNVGLMDQFKQFQAEQAEQHRSIKEKAVAQLREALENAVQFRDVLNALGEQDAATELLNEFSMGQGQKAKAKTSGTRGPGRPRKTETAQAEGEKRGGRGGGPTLQDAIVGVLKDAKEPMRAKDIQQAVLDSGYQTEAENFYASLAETDNPTPESYGLNSQLVKDEKEIHELPQNNVSNRRSHNSCL